MKKKLLVLMMILTIISCGKQAKENKLEWEFDNNPVVELERLENKYEVHYVQGEYLPFTGTAISYHKNGQVSSRIKFVDGKANGKTGFFDENGKLTKIAIFKNGLLQ